MADPISVLMTTYNCADYISKAIKSILIQTYKDFEFLIVDDGSDDDTEKKVHIFNDNRIRYIKKEHEGLAASLNYGLKISKYDWVARMDADDICHPQRLEKQISVLRKDENFISCTWSAYFYNRGIRFTVKTPTDDGELKNKLALHCYINHSSVIYNKNFILLNGGYNTDLNVYEDYELWLRIKDVVMFEVIPEYLIFMRVTPQSLSRNNFNIRKKIILQFQRKYYPLYDDLNTFTKTERLMLSGWREFFYGEGKKARGKFLKLKLGMLIYPRILIAFFLTFFPQKFIDYIIKNTIKYKILYFIKYFNTDFRRVRIFLSQ